MKGKVIGTGKEVLPLGALGALESVNAIHEAPGLSGKYKFFSTLQVVERLAGEGWLPVLAKEQWCRTISGAGFQKHMIRLRQTQTKDLSINDILAEIVLTNAHNGLSSYNILAAFMRLACWNGLVVSQSVFGAIAFRHVGFELDDVIEASFKVVEGIPQIAQHIKDYQAIELNAQERTDFAATALAIRYDAPVTVDRGLAKVADDRSFSIGAILEPLREVDVAPTLWNTFNVIQEKFVKGGKFERTSRAILRNGGTEWINRNKVVGIQAINMEIGFNRSLWGLMEATRERKVQGVALDYQI